MVGKAVHMTIEAGSQLTTRSMVQFTAGLNQLCEILSTRANPPHIWFSLDEKLETSLRESTRFGFIDIQEHLETFLDRKDHVAEVSFFLTLKILNLFLYASQCFEGIKTSVKLQLLNEEEIETSPEVLLELGKALCKLHFQLLLLLESVYKILGQLISLSRGFQVKLTPFVILYFLTLLLLQLTDISHDVTTVRSVLIKTVEDGGQADTPSVSPGPILTGTRPEEEAEVMLGELVGAADWAAALKQARRCR